MYEEMVMRATPSAPEIPKAGHPRYKEEVNYPERAIYLDQSKQVRGTHSLGCPQFVRFHKSVDIIDVSRQGSASHLVGLDVVVQVIQV